MTPVGGSNLSHRKSERALGVTGVPSMVAPTIWGGGVQQGVGWLFKYEAVQNTQKCHY
jgi:hypothetical protein